MNIFDIVSNNIVFQPLMVCDLFEQYTKNNAKIKAPVCAGAYKKYFKRELPGFTGITELFRLNHSEHPGDVEAEMNGAI